MAYTTIDDPGLYFNTVTWTGNDNESRDITGVGFQPDWVWGKRRDDAEPPAFQFHATYFALF